MAQIFGIIGFMLALLALFFASEIMRRSSHRQTELETALFKATLRIQQIESRMSQVDRLATEIRHEKKRQAETLTALAGKGTLGPAADPGVSDRFTPSSQKQKQAG